MKQYLLKLGTISMSAYTLVNIQDLLLQLSDLAAAGFVEYIF